LSRLLPRAQAYERLIRWVIRERRVSTERDLWIELTEQRFVNVDCTVTPLVGRGSLHVLIELSTLSEQKRITREEHLVAQNESVRALLRGLAHEIRNPLGGLRGAAQLLERELDDIGLTEYTQVIVREADRLQDLLKRLLGPPTLPNFRPLNLHEVTERVYALISTQAPPGVSLVRDYDPSIPELSIDLDLLIQAVLNVTMNAVQAVAGAGRVVLRTRVHRQSTIGTRRHRLVAAIDVVDDGPGIPEPLDGTLFYPMVSGRVDGTGLGLSIAQSLVNQHAGLIEFSQNAGLTTFSILLPVEVKR
jgi:two-component system nitrogen regulation sensor histidine kinase GlnL